MTIGHDENRPAEVDVVYTWVDDTWPGYRDELARHAGSGHDLDPNRTRDNLDVLRFSLRSLCTNAPWFRRLYLVTMRPQVPPWLDVDHPRLELVHHDEIIDARYLPTFNSFTILSHCHRLPGLSERFIYQCDDQLFGGPVGRHDLFDARGEGRIYLEPRLAPAPARQHSTSESPWNAARAHCNALLDAAFGAASRHDPGHLPQVIDRDAWQAMLDAWPEAFERTFTSRFRAPYNAVPEFLYPHWMTQRHGHQPVSFADYRRTTHYVSLDNFLPKAWFDTRRLARAPKLFWGLNDNFGKRPSNRVVEHWRAFLEQRFPEPCEFERAPG